MKFIKLLMILFVVTLSSCEKEDLKLPKDKKFGLPTILQKHNSDTVETTRKIKEKKKRKKFFLKKNLTTTKNLRTFASLNTVY